MLKNKETIIAMCLDPNSSSLPQTLYFIKRLISKEMKMLKKSNFIFIISWRGSHVEPGEERDLLPGDARHW